ncbi:unnamed protein product [Caenorhabditis auriculariae]|uniref:LNS2/PITP domain-containing protein n=1 Tax=Caenorhabditis auriculariae TaxID=2777116 RepID=A0A8S1GV88_9PELO|nr:unnamed protein product [Caenorhabditis auriculariae]
MDYAYRVLRNVKYFYNTINPATLSGAIDVVVVEQPNGEYKSTPFHVRFGKYGVFSFNDKYVDISVNGEEIDLKMKLADSGVAFFVEETEEKVPDYLLTSPLPEQESPGQTPSAVDKVLAESLKKLEQVEANEKNDIVKSRSSSPDGGKVHRKPQTEQSLSQAQRKQTLPFSSSVFSDRKYRSLPDLTVLADESAAYHSDDEGSSKRRSKKDRQRMKARGNAFNGQTHKKVFLHSRSQTSALDKMETDEIFETLCNDPIAPEPRKPLRKKSRVAFNHPLSQPIHIHVEDSDSELESSVTSSTASSPSPSIIDQREADRIADGALSDSEVDRHRTGTPEPHDVTDWKWGELPETRELNKRKLQEEKKNQSKASSWSWWWRSANTKADPENPEIPTARDQGIMLDDLLNKAQTDPVNIEKYLGRPASIASVDSGHVSRGVSQPSSPTTHTRAESGSDATFGEKTPTRESVVLATPSVANDHRSRNASDGRSRASSDDIFPLSEDEAENEKGTALVTTQYMQSLRLSSEKLKALNLKHGANECRFSITTKFQGTTWCSCNIYLYKWYEQIVISDIDGTITKSDVLGHVIPAIGGTWAHAGVAELYSRIKNNGYKMVYLSSRAIGQSHTTKQYLKSIAQDSKQLPDGPVLLSPTSIITAFRREVIERRPEEFKIAALSDLKQLFPTANPYYAGFGNRDTDVKSYRAVSVPAERILIIDPTGRVRRSDSVGYVSSYTTMANETVDFVFPPLSISVRDQRRLERLSSTWSRPLEHSDFTHWHAASEQMSLVDDDLLKYEEVRKTSIKEAKALRK